MKQFTVTADVTYTEWVSVAAETEEEAKTKAMDYFVQNSHGRITSNDDVSIYEVAEEN